jgi:hypothetical protein
VLVTHGASAYGALLNDSWVLDLEYGYAEQVPLPLLASPPPPFLLENGSMRGCRSTRAECVWASTMATPISARFKPAIFRV